MSVWKIIKANADNEREQHNRILAEIDTSIIAAAASGVSSVNGDVGVVVLTAADVGAATSAQGALASSAVQPSDNISTLVNDSGFIAASFETVSKNLRDEDPTYNYTLGKLTSIVYTGGVTKTFNYTGDKLTSIVLSGATPSGINLTKTFSYTVDELTSVSYS